MYEYKKCQDLLAEISASSRKPKNREEKPFWNKHLKGALKQGRRDTRIHFAKEGNLFRHYTTRSTDVTRRLVTSKNCNIFHRLLMSREEVKR